MSMFGDVASKVPNMQGVGGWLLWGLGFLLFIIIVALAVGLWAYWFINKKQFNKRIIVFEKVNGIVEKRAEDQAKEVKIGHAGDTIFFFRKHKKWQPRPTIQTGRNTYWFYKREDGELINIGVEDIDQNMRLMRANYLDNEMKYARSSLQKMIKDRYEKQTFWEKHGSMIISIVYMVLTGLFLIYLFGKTIESQKIASQSAIAVQESMAKVKEVLGALDNLCSNSGLTPAAVLFFIFTKQGYKIKKKK